MALFGSLIKWGLGHQQPSLLQPNLRSSEELARQAVNTGDTLLPEVQALEKKRTDFLTGQITERQNLFAPWLSAFGANLGETATALAGGNLPPDIAKSYERAGRSAAFGGGFGYAPKATNLAALFGAEGALRGIATGVSTAESWLSLMNNIYAPATVNYADKYLPSTAATTDYETRRELIRTQAKNMARQFKYATDPLTGEGGIYQGIEQLGDSIGSALSVYLGNFGQIGELAGGIMGMGSGGGSSSVSQFLGGLGLGGGGGKKTPSAGNSWFGFDVMNY